MRPLIGAGIAGVAQIDPRGLQRRTGSGDGGARLPRLRRGVGIVLLGDGLHLGQRPIAGGRVRAASAVAGRWRRLACGLVDRGLIEAGIDLEQRLALADVASLRRNCGRGSAR